MPDEYPLTLPQADQARAAFAAIEDELDFIKARAPTDPTRDGPADTARNPHDRDGGSVGGDAGAVKRNHVGGLRKAAGSPRRRQGPSGFPRV
jgi:hypothetical protein